MPRSLRVSDPAASNEQLRASLLLLVAGSFAFTIALLTMHDVARGLLYDEAVFVSQVAVGEPASHFALHRSRGITLLAAPVAVFGPPPVVLKVWAAVLGGLGLFLAFSPWVRRLGYGAVAAALLFAASWPTLRFAPELMPNFPVAVAAVAAAGHLATWIEDDTRRRPLLFGAAWLGFAALVRPPDAVTLGMGLAGAVVLLRPRRAIGGGAVLALGGLVGIMPWFVEGAIRFNESPIGMFFTARERGISGETKNALPVFLHNLEGPGRCANECRRQLLAVDHLLLPPPRTAVALAIMTILIVAGLWLSDRSTRRAVVVALVPMVALIGFYAFAGSPVNQRYLLPINGLFFVAVGVGLAAVWRWLRFPWARLGLLAVVLAAVPWQASIARSDMQDYYRNNVDHLIAEALTEAAEGEPCAAAAIHYIPQIQYRSPCEVVRMAGRDDVIQWDTGNYPSLKGRAEQGYRVFAIAIPDGLSENALIAEWDSEPIGGTEYHLFAHEEGDPLPGPGERAGS